MEQSCACAEGGSGDSSRRGRGAVEANSQETGTPPVALEAAKSSAWHATRERREEILVVRIRGCAAGDETALALLYDETSALVYGLALRILRDSAAAEEVTIDVYAQAYRQASRYDPTRGSATDVAADHDTEPRDRPPPVGIRATAPRSLA